MCIVEGWWYLNESGVCVVCLYAGKELRVYTVTEELQKEGLVIRRIILVTVSWMDLEREGA